MVQRSAVRLPEYIEALITSSFRGRKLQLPYQKGIIIWMTGLSGSGKSTIANQLAETLAESNFFSIVLDGDELRKTLNKDLGFSEADRTENIRRAAELAKLLVQKNIIVICSFITPLQKHRELAAEITGDRYFEVFVDCPLWVCEQRDEKGLYRKARNHQITDFTGIDSPYETPEAPGLHLKTDKESLKESVERLNDIILPLIRLI